MHEQREISEGGGQGGRSGCLKAALSAPILIVLAPIAAAVRLVARWRRGKAPRVEWRWGVVAMADGHPMARLRAAADLALDVDGGRVLTEAVVRVAERLCNGDQIYHMVHTEPGGDGEVAMPVGPSIQCLAERFYLVSRRSALEGLPVTWVALPREVALGGVLENDGDSITAFERMLRMPLQWGMVIVRQTGSASIRFNLDLVVPEGTNEDVERALEPLRECGIER